MQQFYGLQLISTYVVSIVNKRLPDAAPRQKLSYIGILTIIDVLRSKGDVPTAKRLSEETGVDYPTMTKYVSQLVKAGILEKKKIAARHGRGHASELYFAKTEELRELVEKTLGPLAVRE